MEFGADLTVPATAQEALDYLLQPENLAQCVPGASLERIVDERTWEGRLRVQLGPISLIFDGEVHLTEVDFHSYHVGLTAEGSESKGKGSASAEVDCRLTPVAQGGTQVSLTATILVTGALEQFGRGIIEHVCDDLVARFAKCIHDKLGDATSV